MARPKTGGRKRRKSKRKSAHKVTRCHDLKGRFTRCTAKTLGRMRRRARGKKRKNRLTKSVGSF